MRIRSGIGLHFAPPPLGLELKSKGNLSTMVLRRYPYLYICRTRNIAKLVSAMAYFRQIVRITTGFGSF